MHRVVNHNAGAFDAELAAPRRRPRRRGESLEVDDERLVRLSIVTDRAIGRLGRPGVIYACSPSGARCNLNLEEDLAFGA